MPFVVAAGHRLEYRLIEAARPGLTPLVLLHEGLGSIAQWRDFPDRLAAATGAPVVVYSRYGHGHSEPLAGPRRVDYMHDEALTALPELFERLAVADPVLIGHSDGASIALIHAGAAGQGVRGLVLIAPHVFVEDCTIAAIAAAREAYRRGDLRSRLARYHDDVEGMFAGWNDIWLSPDFRDWNIEQYLPRITVPLLLIQGADDPYGTLAQLAAIRRGAGSSDIRELVLPGCGHVPQRDTPDTVLAAIADFCAAFR
jgi:pimeloyl-ACP methyl ester carboxylesterase